ncbi:flagellar basal body P-ring formation chaperone FlgA [Candidatus Acidulodesulfobacterium sp. H_13]|uniref:flagellar basal body P-ring formation chaperone FlgA n=1 Tax=Candidatus Acidulodesulfobacterium sp. H_13 TaxID=3395470 RepID=UPI003AF62FBE
MPRKIILAFLLLYAGLLLLHGVTTSFAGDISGTNHTQLKKFVINSYLKEIEPKFRRYFSFNGFAFTIPVKNIGAYFMKSKIDNPEFSGYHTVIVKLLDRESDSVKGIAYVSFKTKIYAPVAVASQTIGKFQIIKRDDVKISYVSIPSLSGGYYLSKKYVIGREARFVIPQNSTLSKEDTEEKTVIVFGDEVDIVYKSYGLVLETKGVALQSGALNSIIRVKNIYSGAVLSCVVKSDKIVTVR